MDDAGGVGGGERVGHVDAHLQHAHDGQRRCPGQLGLQVVAFQELEDQEGLAALVAPDVEGARDPRVPDGPRDPGLVAEALERRGRRGQPRVEHLEREGPLNDGVDHLVDGAHAAAAEQAHHPIAATDDRAHPRVHGSAQQPLQPGGLGGDRLGALGVPGELPEPLPAMGAGVELVLDRPAGGVVQLAGDEGPELGFLRARHRDVFKLSRPER